MDQSADSESGKEDIASSKCRESIEAALNGAPAEVQKLHSMPLRSPSPCRKACDAKYTVKYYFRGTWSPTCRSQLIALGGIAGKLKDQFVEIEAITAQPYGDAYIKGRLAAAGVPDLPFKVISDPDHKFLETSAGDIFT